MLYKQATRGGGGGGERELCDTVSFDAIMDTFDEEFVCTQSSRISSFGVLVNGE